MSDLGGTAGEPGAGAPGAQGAGWAREPHHFWRMIAIWSVASLVVDLLYWFVAGPHVPPGAMSTTASGAQFDFNILFVTAAPVVLAVWTYMGYAIFVWRASRGGPEPVGGLAARGNVRVQVAWITTTTIVVFGMFVFGTIELVTAGAGGAEGPNPIWTPASKNILPIQVIGQQWKFTYRYPTFGGMETNNLIIPNDTTIAFHVTSLDVIHSFWAYQIGVKADANPGVDNVAFTTTRQMGTFDVRCSELCGIWHGAMFDYGKVVSKSAFEKWAVSTEQATAANTKLLPAFAWTYTPSANGAGGSYYTSTVAPYSKVETYGATPTHVKVTSPAGVTTTTSGTTG